MNFYLLLFGMILLNLAGNSFGKFWAISNRSWIFLLALTFYLVSASLFILAIKKSSLSISTPLATISVTIGSILIGVLYFQERLTTPQIFGIALSVTAIFFLTFPFQILQK